jgi:GT2 family glycosyltransferase
MPIPLYLLHWNAPDLALASVRSFRASRDVEVAVIVIDNASEPDGLAKLEAGLPAEVPLVRLDTNEGFSGAANAGITQLLSGDVDDDDIFFISAHDTVVEESTIAALVAALRQHPDYGIVGPAQWAPGFAEIRSIGGTFEGSKGAPVQRAVTLPPAQLAQELIEVDWIKGALMGFRRQCIIDAGPFDPALFAYYEDVDVCLRARDAGWRVGVAPAARAAESGYSASYRTLAYFIARNRLLISRKRLGRRGTAATAARIAVELVQALGGGLDWRRPADRRATSLAFARGRLLGLRDGLTNRGGPPPTGSATRVRGGVSDEPTG